ncbi:MAG: MEDS domain-containing protein [Cyanobacteria bacterium SZAS LIN-3]|nr:MEDS domain-containing protein [Cyanobacteria bacterium SZAS LIN-3]
MHAEIFSAAHRLTIGTSLEAQGPHSHPCLIFDTKKEQEDAFVPFLQAGLLRGEKCIYIYDDSDPQWIIHCMSVNEFPLAKYLQSGAFSSIHKNEAYLTDGHFELRKMNEFWRLAIEKSATEGYSALRVAAEMTWALGEEQGCDQLIAYESTLNNMFPDFKVSALCQYDRKRFDAQTIKEIIHVHPIISVEGQLLSNPSSISPNVFQQSEARMDVQALLDNLVLINQLGKANLELQRRITQEASFSLLVASVKDYAIFMLDTDGNILSWNEGAQRIKGYSAAEIIGQNFSKFYTAEAVARRHPQHELEIAKIKGRYEEEGPRVRRDGSIFWANVVITAMFDQGQHIGFAKVTRDLTERKHAEESLARSLETVTGLNEEMHQLAYTISHELQEPVVAMTSYSKLLLSRYKDRLGDDANEFLQRIEKGARMTARMVDDLWTYARVTKPGGMKTNVNIGALVENAVVDLKGLLESSGCSVNHPPYSEFPTVECNKDQLIYVIRELITNAIKHHKGSQKPQVDISVEAERNGWTVLFKDNGSGIDRFFAKQAFSVYQRLDGKPDETGTGMGLPICKKIIESEHQGIIGFESVTGAGATFYFWLPNHSSIGHSLRVSH